MAESQHSLPPVSQPTPIQVLPDIAPVCPICKRGFKDADFAILVWLDEHTPAHLSCCHEAHEQYTNYSTS